MTADLQRAHAAVPAELAARVAAALGDELGDAGLTPAALDRAARAAVVAHQLYAVDRVYREIVAEQPDTSPGPCAHAAGVAGERGCLLPAGHDGNHEGEHGVTWRAAPDPAPVSPGVPRCHGRVAGARPVGDDADPCTLPLGHHGGCR